MKTQDKELLLKDLCARLTYGVKFETKYESHKNNIYELIAVNKHCETVETFGAIWWNIEDIKPYLRPMSSMTEEEYKCFVDVLKRGMICRKCYDWHEQWIQSPSVEEWLNANHFDFRGLIPIGLALPATDGIV